MNCSCCGICNELVTFINTHGQETTMCKCCISNKNINITTCNKCNIEYEYNYSTNDYDTICSSMCHKCYLEYAEERDEEYNSLGWGYRPDPIFFGGEKNDNKLFMGIELETDDGEEDLVRSLKEDLIKSHELNINGYGYGMFWGKEDGSLSDNGMEIVSHPATLEYHKTTDVWKKMLEKVQDAKLKSNDCSNCGIHIHMNRSYLTNEQIHKLDALVNLYSRTFRRFARRNSRDYAIYNPNKTENNLGRNNNNNSRYSCLNFHNSQTVEWRIFKGNTKYESIMALFELIQGCCDFVKQNEVTLPFIFEKKIECKHALKNFLEQQNFQYLPAYTEMCRVWRDLEEIPTENNE